MRPVLLIAGALFLVLMVLSGGYGYHRDELYFLTAGDHLAIGYADQGPLTPFIARVMDEIAPDSLVALRLPSALMAAAVVVLTGLTTAELGGSRRAQAIAAASIAAAAFVLVVGHLLSTTTFDLLAWTALTYVIVRAVRTGDDRLWVVAGAVLGLALLNKPLAAFLALALLIGVAISGPRRLIRSPWVWAGAAIALALWAPWLVWQADHGWPQLEVAESIQGGGSTSSEPRWLFLPFQFLLVSPLLAPVWIAGLVRLFRDPAQRDLRFLGWTWVVLAGIFLVTGGKPYYMAGLFPLLIAAGAPAVDDWLERGANRTRLFVAAVAVSALIGATIGLPILPRDSLGPVLEVNEDAGETIGWPELARTVARVRDTLPRDAPVVVFTGNYGQAGAVDRYGPALGLPRAYSGHNGYHEWGPPPDDARGPVIVVGRPDAGAFRDCAQRTRITNASDVDNGERGTPVFVCRGTTRPWSQVWESLESLG